MFIRRNLSIYRQQIDVNFMQANEIRIVNIFCLTSKMAMETNLVASNQTFGSSVKVTTDSWNVHCIQ